MKKYMMGFFVVGVLFLNSFIGAWSWQGIRNNSYTGTTINLKDSSSTPTLGAGEMVPNAFIGQSGEFRVKALTGWFAPDFNALEQEVVNGRGRNENRNKVPVVHISSLCLGCGWTFGIAWEDSKAFNDEVREMRNKGWY
jgi:hypothetical protein